MCLLTGSDLDVLVKNSAQIFFSFFFNAGHASEIILKAENERQNPLWLVCCRLSFKLFQMFPPAQAYKYDVRHGLYFLSLTWYCRRPPGNNKWHSCRCYKTRLQCRHSQRPIQLSILRLCIGMTSQTLSFPPCLRLSVHKCCFVQAKNKLFFFSFTESLKECEGKQIGYSAYSWVGGDHQNPEK